MVQPPHPAARFVRSCGASWGRSPQKQSFCHAPLYGRPLQRVKLSIIERGANVQMEAKAKPAKIFAGQHIEVHDWRRDDALDILVVAFPIRRERPSLSTLGFSRWLTSRNLSSLDVTVSSNHWFQVAETDAALAAIREVAKNYKRVVAYGSSMGGYAAIACGAAIGAHATIALSPQSTVDPEKVPWERRWDDDVAKIQALCGFPRDDLPALVSPSSEIYVLADPWNLDGRHLKRIMAAAPHAQKLLIHGGGHPAGYLALEYQLLSKFVTRAILEGGSVLEWRRLARERRASSSTYWSRLATYAAARGKFQVARNAALRAVALDPEKEGTVKNAATSIIRTGDLKTAFDILERFPSLPTASLHTLFMHADLAWRLGKPERATFSLDLVEAQAPDHKRLATLRAAVAAISKDAVRNP